MAALVTLYRQKWCRRTCRGQFRSWAGYVFQTSLFFSIN